MEPGAEDSGQGAVRTIGVVVDDFAVAAGATDFIVSFVDGLVRAARGRKVLLIFRGTQEESREWGKRLVDAGIPRMPAIIVERTERALAAACRTRNIDLIGPLYAPPGPDISTPWLGYLYDFQHRHWPQWFSAEAIAERDAAFRRMLQSASAVVVHSRSVKEDAERFFPGQPAKIFPLPLSAAPRPEWLSAEAASAQRQYGIAGEYFLVSNQFWVHKRHETAIEAFGMLARRHSAVRLVLTGATEDWRYPTRLQDLKDLTARWNVADRVHILGFIPKLDQIALMRGARALVQPTAFEGAPGGHSVYDAISLGVPTIVSDIPVNREIADHVTSYFGLDDAAALADRMEAVLAAPPVPRSAEALLREGNERRLHFGEQIWAAVDHAARHAQVA